MDEHSKDSELDYIAPGDLDIETANIEARKKLAQLKELKAKKRKQDLKNFFKEAFVNKHGVFVWIFSSVFWLLLCFLIFTKFTITYTEQIVQKCYEKELQKDLEEPLLQAHVEAEQIIKDARDKAKKIIETAKAESN